MKIQPILATAALVGTLGLSTMQPAKADGAASTRNLILGAAAVIAGVAIESNVAHKNAQAQSIQGYLPDGATVYGDGRVVEPNGTSFYPGNQNEQVTCNDGSCRITGNGYAPPNGYDNGNNGGYNSSYAGGWNRNRVAWRR